MGYAYKIFAMAGLVALLALAGCNQAPQAGTQAPGGNSKPWTLEEITAAREGCAAKSAELGAVDPNKLAFVCSCVVEDAARRWSADDWLRNAATYTQTQVRDGTVEKCRIGASPNVGGTTWSQAEIAQVKAGCVASAKQVRPTADESAIILGCGCIVEDASKRWEFPDYAKNETTYTRKQTDDGTMARCMAGGGSGGGGQGQERPSPISSKLHGVWESNCIQATQSSSVRSRWEVEGESATYRLLEYKDGSCTALIRTTTDTYGGLSDGGAGGDFKVDLTRVDAQVKYVDPVFALAARFSNEWGYAEWPIWTERRVTDRQKGPGLVPQYPLNERRYDLFRLVGDRLYTGDSNDAEDRRTPDKRPKDAYMFIPYTKRPAGNVPPVAGVQPVLSLKIGGTLNNYPVLSDADGDELTVSCEGPCPPGLTVANNLYSYTPTAPGARTANMVVRDERGADTRYELRLEAKKEFLVYRDIDGDGYGSGALQTVEAAQEAVPAGYVTNGNDCLDSDASKWQNLSYTHRDADGDGMTLAGAGTICAGATLPAGYLLQGSGNDCADGDATKWQTLSYSYRDMDGDGYTVSTTPGTMCVGAALPSTYKAAANGNDCADGDATKWQTLSYSYRDMDGDGYTVSTAPGTMCVGASLPNTYTATANGNDCADGDATKWQNLSYSHRDMDGDGYTVSTTPGTMCVGAALPSTYKAAANGNDCADGDATKWQNLTYSHLDTDGDGYTVSTTPGTMCVGAALPSTYKATSNGNDCADGDATKWQIHSYSFRDEDGDGVTVAQAGDICSNNSLPTGYFTVPNGNDCSDNDPTKWQSATYSFRDMDGDGYTVATTPGTMCIGVALPNTYKSVANGSDCEDSDATKWKTLGYSFRDMDGDGYTVPTTPDTMCVGSGLPLTYKDQANGNDCADDDVLKWSMQPYNYRDRDGNGSWTYFQGEVCGGQSLPQTYLNLANAGPYLLDPLESASRNLIAAGGQHTCAVTSAGTVKCWGDNQFGQLGVGSFLNHSVPTTVADLPGKAVSVTAGWSHTCALTDSGGVLCWGRNNYGQIGDGTIYTNRNSPTPVSGLSSGVAGIFAGSYHTCALLTQGGIKCWGDNDAGQIGDGTTIDKSVPTSVIGLDVKVVGIFTSSGSNHNCALLENHVLKCWGENSNGQVGDATQIDRSAPASVTSFDAAVTDVSIGGTFTCALLDTGVVKCWGYNYDGQLGDGSVISSLVPTAVVGISDRVVKISTGGSTTCALLQNGGVKCWGGNLLGSLGNGTVSKFSNVPTDIVGLNNGVVALSLGSQFGCALIDNGSLKCWGSNSLGQLGNGTAEHQSHPSEVLGLSSGVTSVASGSGYSCAIIDGGSVKCWGANNSGQIGSGSTEYTAIPTQVLGLTSGVEVIATGGGHTCAVLSSGALKCWGSNFHGYDYVGQLGDGSSSNQSEPVPVIGMNSGVKGVTAGVFHTCALLVDGGVKCWGKNNAGQIGDGTFTNRHEPTPVIGLDSGVSSIVAGGLSTCAVLDNGSVKCWGKGGSSTPSPVSGLSSGVVSVTVALDHFCALFEAGNVKCWGDNDAGQIGDGSTAIPFSPVEVTGLSSGVAHISAGTDHSCAILTNGGVKCWGANGSGQLGDGTVGPWATRRIPTQVNGLTSGYAFVIAGYYHTCAISEAGAVKCWGSNTAGSLGNGQFGYSALPVDAQFLH